MLIYWLNYNDLKFHPPKMPGNEHASLEAEREVG